MPPNPRPLISSAGESLVEVMFAVSLASFAFGSLFLLSAHAIGLIRGQRETLAATHCLQERCEQLRGLSWPSLTSASSLQQKVLGAAPQNAGYLSGLVEDITVNPYPAPTSPKPLHVQRTVSGQANVISQPDSTLFSSPVVRVDVRESWLGSGRSHLREQSMLLALGQTIQ